MKKITKVSIALMCSMMAMSTFAQSVADVSNKYNEAGELMVQKNYAGAITAFESVVEMGLVAGGDALTTVQEAQKYIPQCYYSNAMKLASQKNFDAAIENFNKAAELGELYGAIDVMTKAKGMLSRVYLAQGGAAFNAKDWAKSIEVFGKGYAANPNDTQLGLLYAKSYAENGQIAEATTIYTDIMALEARNSRFAAAANQAKSELSTYLLLLAQEAATANNLDSVVVLTGSILAYDSLNSSATMMRVQTATNIKDYNAVISYGEQAIAAQTEQEAISNANFLLGAAYQNKENKAKAIELYKKVVAGSNVNIAKEQIAELSK